MNVVSIEKLQLDLSIGIEMSDRVILRSVAIYAGIGVEMWQHRTDQASRMDAYTQIQERAEAALRRLGFVADKPVAELAEPVATRPIFEPSQGVWLSCRQLADRANIVQQYVSEWAKTHGFDRKREGIHTYYRPPRGYVFESTKSSYR